MARSRNPVADATYRELGKGLPTARGAGPSPIDLVTQIRSRLTPKQRDVLDDPSRFLSLLCPRRAGKTFFLAAKLIVFCLSRPGARCAFGTMTLKKARKILWTGKDGIKAWDNRYSLRLTFNNSDFTAIFPNGSQISLLGFETEADVDRVRGEHYDLFVVDECAAFPTALFDELIDEAVTPALMDTLGTLVIAGTPGAVMRGNFYHATSIEGQKQVRDDEGHVHARTRPHVERDRPEWANVAFDWSFHSWTIADNIAMPHIWGEAQKLRRRKRWSDANPIWRREYLGHWVADNSILVYKYDAGRNGWEPQRTPDNPLGLPKGHEWRFGLGCDLGFDNDFALQVIAWCDDLAHFFQVYGYSAPGLTVSGIAQAIKVAGETCGDFDFLVGDRGGLGKTIFATLEQEYGIAIEPADKHEKVAHIELLNSDFIDGRAFLIRGSRVAGEMEILPWDIPRGYEPEEGRPLVKRREAEGFPKDNCDALLYCVTRAQHRFAQVRQNLLNVPRSFDEDEDLRKVLNPKRPALDGGGRDSTVDGPVTWSEWMH